jgi:chromosome condensin MukBEF ATPase and DNA-binding subunit MukB
VYQGNAIRVAIQYSMTRKLLFLYFFRQRILNQTSESNEKLRAQIKSAQDERKQLLKQIEESR